MAEAGKSLKIRLKRNLRRQVLRGHPWIYREAIESPAGESTARLCKVLDPKGVFLAWGFHDPHSPLALRLLSTESKPPGVKDYVARLIRAQSLRQGLRHEQTTGFRLINGEGDRLPGLVCDLYGDVAVLQCDGLGPSQFWPRAEIAKWLQEQANCRVVFEKSRVASTPRFQKIAGAEASPVVQFCENGLLFEADVEQGQKTGFFFDQRENRAHLRPYARDQRVLNLFSYTGGFSIYCGAGGAEHVTSVDIAAGALECLEHSWALNSLDAHRHESVCADVFEFLSAQKEKWDLVIVDPPSMASSEKHKAAAIKKYTEVFTLAAKKVGRGGHLVLSSCSSHISFEDFFEITQEALSAARRKGSIVRVSGQGLDHPFPHICRELRYIKFFHLALD